MEARTRSPLLASQPRLIVEGVRLDGVSLARRAKARALILVQPEAPLDEAAVSESRLRLLSTGQFQTVTARLDRGQARGRVIVVFECVERSTLSLDEIHFGAARPSDVWLGAEISDLDPFGIGLAPALGVVTSVDQTAGRLGLTGFRLFGGALDVDFGVLAVDAEEPLIGATGQRLNGAPVPHIPLPYQRLNLGIGLHHRLRPLLHLRGRLYTDLIEADLPTGAEEVQPGALLAPYDFMLLDGGSWQAGGLVTLEYDSRDDPAHPRRGIRAGVTLNGTAGDYTWASAVIGVEHFMPMPFGHSMHVHVRGGGLVGDAPLFNRFFIGDLHGYVPERALGLNFARRRGPFLLDGTLGEQRYETVAGRAGVEYRLTLGNPEPYAVELFIGGSVVTLFTPDELVDRADRAPSAFPVDAFIDVGLRVESEIGVMGLSIGNFFLLADP